MKIIKSRLLKINKIKDAFTTLSIINNLDLEIKR